MVLDGSGFVRRSRLFAGNVAEGSTLQEMLTGLGTPPGALVIMDAPRLPKRKTLCIATAANIAWLAAQGYRYLVVSRQHSPVRSGTRRTDPDRIGRDRADAARRQRGRCGGPAVLFVRGA
nr:hypothetical protein [uncultured Rhodopila sp.]